MLGLRESEIITTTAYKEYRQEREEDAEILLRARVLAYAPATWASHSSAIREFLAFVRDRQTTMFECTPSVINLFQLKLSQDGRTYQSIRRVIASLSFVYRFFLMPNFADEKTVRDVSKFVSKSSAHSNRKKDALDSAKIRKLWDAMEKNGGIERLSKVDLRSFVMTIFQHKSFCRYSDLAHVKLSDVIFNADYFKIIIRYSKTDQAGIGAPVYVVKDLSGFRDAHMLLCIYLQNMNFPHDEDVYLFPPLK